MKITKEWLKKHGACSKGRNWFNKFFPDGGDIDAVLILVTQDADADDSWVSWLMSRAEYKEVGWLEGLEIPGSLDLSDCTLPDGVKLPDSVGGYLDLSGCTLPEGMKLPDSVGGSLYLSGCTLPDGVKLPDSVGGYLYLRGSNFKTTDVPEHLRSRVIL